MVDWVQVVTVSSTAVGLVTVAAETIFLVAASRRLSRDVLRLTEDARRNAINSSNLQVLGKYLVDDVGSVRISDVVSSEDVGLRTFQAFAAVRRFVDKPEETPGDEEAPWTSPEVVMSDELRDARLMVLAGEIWNGLALMRRNLEIVLRALDPALAKSRMGAGQLISRVEKSGHLAPEAAHHLRYAVQVANRAVHGDEIDVGVALEAMDSADYALGRISRYRSGRDN
jgi:hypothetical protein